MENCLWDWFKQTHFAKSMLSCKNSNGKFKNIYHEEDNVFIHTKMVYKEVIKRYKNKIDAEFYFILLMSAICHDISKPVSRTIGFQGYVKFPNHANIGFYDTLELLDMYRNAGMNETCYRLTNDIVTRILNIVVLHNIYKYTNDIDTLFKKYSNSLEDVYMFSVCDINGRKTSVKHDISSIKDFILSESYKNRKNENIIEKDKRIIFLIGPPSSGKTYLVNKTFINTEYFKILSLDELIESINFRELGLEESNISFKEKMNFIFKNKLNGYLSELFKNVYLKKEIENGRHTIIIDRRNMTLDEREFMLNFDNENNQFKEKFSKYSIESYLMAIPPRIIMEYNKNLRDDKFVEEETIRSYINKFEAPSFLEFDKINYIFHNSLFDYNRRLVI